MARTTQFMLLAAFLLAHPLFAEPQTTNGEINHVIIYHGRALVTRNIILDKMPDNEDLELLVEDLPERILPESIYAQGSGNIEVLSVRYRVKEIEKDTRTEVQELDRQFEELEKQLHRAKRDLELAYHTAGRFAKMWNLGLDGADVSLQRGAFSAESMTDYLNYLAGQGENWHHKAVDLEEQIKILEKELQQIQQEKEKLQRDHKQNIRQALVYLHIPKINSANSIQLSYLVDGADWSPQYNLKAQPNNQIVNLEYNAVVHQSSGEDWTNARLALSTAAPALIATPPALEPLQITLVETGKRSRGFLGRKVPASSNDLMAVSTMPQEAVESYSYMDQSDLYSQMAQSRYDNISMGIKAQQTLNTIAMNTQMVEFEADKRLLQQIKQKAVSIRRAEGVSVMYALGGRLTLPSKSDQQLVTIASIQCPATFTFVAAPLLTDYVYLEGEMTNTSDTILLPGVADTFRNGEFVGKGDMKLVTIGQTCTAGFGVDSQIQVAREFKDKNIKTLLGNRVDENHYRIAIDNYYDKPVAVRLMDRLPWTENKELDIELTDVSHPLSTDAEYVRTQKDKGILRWDLVLDPNTHGKDATIVNYTFTMKYDNDMAIINIQ